MNKSAKWIWGENQDKDSYLSFKNTFEYSQNAVLSISAQTEFVAFVNGKRVLFGQFAGYEDINYIESVNISKYCKKNATNELVIIVHYEGINTFTHIDCGAGLIYSVEDGEKVLCCSDERTEYSIDTHYAQGEKKLLTIQIGYSSAMQTDGKFDYKPSKIIERAVTLLPRPLKNIVLKKPLKAKRIKENIFDFGKEETGYLRLEVRAKEDCTVTVSYGEHIKNGHVARFLPGGYLNAGRDFSLVFRCKKGKNVFEQFFVRIAGRYLQIDGLDKVTVKELTVIPTRYPLTVKSSNFVKGIDKKIYDTCLRTLQLCMQNHYEDCPWREQSLYVLDSRNQMLCGYKAFDEVQYQREMLIFISKSKKIGNLLEITYPAKNTPAIPFFSLMYVVAVGEYIQTTKDYSIIPIVEQTVFGILDEFVSRIDKKGLIPAFGKPFWNFYEWTDGSGFEEELDERNERVLRYDLIINSAFIYALNKYKEFDERCNRYALQAKNLLKAIKDNFYNAENGLFYLSDNNKNKYSQFSNALCILIGLGDDRTLQAVKGNTLIPATLSMAGFVYDVLLKTDDEADKKFIVEDIRKKYKIMLDEGATTFWETLNGVNEKDKACSLCHGWSAMPIYYYNKIFNKKEK